MFIGYLGPFLWDEAARAWSRQLTYVLSRACEWWSCARPVAGPWAQWLQQLPVWVHMRTYVYIHIQCSISHIMHVCIYRIPVGARFSAPVQTGPGAYPTSCTMGTGSFPGVKRLGCGADHPPRSKCWGHERVELYLYSPSGPQWPVIGRTFTLYPIYKYILYT